MPHHRNLWLQDFTTVPAAARHPARYALQLFLGDPSLRKLIYTNYT